MNRFHGLSLMVIASVFSHGQADASSVASLTRHWLSCGGTRFELTTAYSTSSGMIGQSMIAHLADGETHHVDLRMSRTYERAETPSDDGPVSSVEEWQCLKERRRTFVALLYVCNSGMSDMDIKNYCKGWNMKEWFRYIDLDGQPLDRGFSIEDPRYRGLEPRLGLPSRDDGHSSAEVMIPVE